MDSKKCQKCHSGSWRISLNLSHNMYILPPQWHIDWGIKKSGKASGSGGDEEPSLWPPSSSPTQWGGPPSRSVCVSPTHPHYSLTLRCSPGGIKAGSWTPDMTGSGFICTVCNIFKVDDSPFQQTHKDAFVVSQALYCTASSEEEALEGRPLCWRWGYMSVCLNNPSLTIFLHLGAQSSTCARNGTCVAQRGRKTKQTATDYQNEQVQQTPYDFKHNPA